LICVNEEVKRAVSKRRRSKKQRECLKRQLFEIEIEIAYAVLRQNSSKLEWPIF
jgi:hypothetical protein